MEEKTKRPRQKGIGKGRPTLHGVRMVTMTLRILPENKAWLAAHFGPKNVCREINNLFTRLRENEEGI
jgi:hypothetical protein